MQAINLRVVRLAYWLIRLRWYAILGIIAGFVVAKYLLRIGIWAEPVYYIVFFLVVLNVISYSFLKYIQKSQIRRSLSIVHRVINFQISTDLIVLTLLLHFSGGVENPLIIYYIFHMIIGGIVLKSKWSYFQTTLALLLVGGMTFLEYFGIIPHYPLEGFIMNNMYNNLTYLLCTGIIFISTSYFVVYITRSIIKESNKHEMAYLQANVKLKQKDKIKNEYVMRITHDIKGHIAAVQSCISVLNIKSVGELTPQQKEFTDRALNRIKLLNKFSADLLTITKRRSQIKPDRKFFNLTFSIEDLLKKTEQIALEHNIKLVKNIDASVNNIYGEQFSIEEALGNLIDNAMKYTSGGKTITVNVTSQDDNVLIEIIDEGIGIPENELQMIFDEFYRASNVRNSFAGSGLGLTISKLIIEDHGGKIMAESKLDSGSKFSVLLKTKK